MPESGNVLHHQRLMPPSDCITHPCGERKARGPEGSLLVSPPVDKPTDDRDRHSQECLLDEDGDPGTDGGTDRQRAPIREEEEVDTQERESDRQEIAPQLSCPVSHRHGQSEQRAKPRDRVRVVQPSADQEYK